MQKSKVLQILSTFSSDDFQRFRLFLESPFFNTNRKILALFDFLSQFRPNFDDSNLNSTSASALVFPDSPDRADAKEAITKLMSVLLDLTEAFVSHVGLQRDPFILEQIRLKYYREVGLHKWEKTALREMSAALEQYPYLDETRTNRIYILEKERASWAANLQAFQEDLDLSNYVESLDQFYIRAKLECLCHQKNHSSASKKGYDLSSRERLYHLIDSQQNPLTPLTLLWQSALDLLCSPHEETLFYQLKRNLSDIEHKLPQAEIRTIYGFLFNTSRTVFSRREDYSKELFSLYRSCLNNNALLVDGQISPTLFQNIIATGIAQHEIRWVSNFIDKYQHLIYSTYVERTDVVKFCRALVLFEQIDYNKSLDLLNETRFKDIQLKLSERRLRIKIYFELNFTDSIEDGINSFRKFLSIHKNAIPLHHIEANRFFINFVAYILHFQDLKDHRRRQISGEIRESVHVYEKSWLEKKLQAAMCPS